MSEAMEELTASYFLRAWHDASRSSKPDDGTERERESSPKALDTEESSLGFALVGPDRLSASYPHVIKRMHDVEIVQADRTAPRKRMVYYFEISVKNAGAMGRVSFGFTISTSTYSRHHPGYGYYFTLAMGRVSFGFTISTSTYSRHHPGWEAGSCGYYGLNGRVCRGPVEGETFGQTVAIGDTVGCGVNYGTNQLLFTKNGVLIGDMTKDVEGLVIPTIILHSENEEVTVNFGNTPFLFDLKAYKADHRARLQKNIDEMEIARGDGFRMVRSYLQHYGYEETLRLFDTDVENEALVQENGSNEEDGKYALSQRKMIRQMIMCGQVDDAITILKEWFPQIMKNDLSPIRFFLHSQKFVELVRDDKLSEAIVLGRNEFDKFRSVLKVEDQIRDCASLLAYKLPHESCVGYLLEESHRELVADLVNATILSTNPNMEDEQFCTQSSLERLIRQLTTCFSENMASSMYQGEVFDLRRILESQKK